MTKTKKYVRILKAKYESSWYADKIGEVFKLTGDTVSFYDVSVPGVFRLIKVEDAELIVTEKRPAEVGERVLIMDKCGTSDKYKNGDVLTADRRVGAAITTKEVDLTFIFHSEYEVIVNNEDKNEGADEMENKLLIENAKTVFEKKGDKYFGYKSRLGDIVIGGNYSYAFVVHYAKTNEDVVIIPGDVNAVTTPVCTTEEERLWKPEKTAQERRDGIVEQAKEDIENLKRRSPNGKLSYIRGNLLCDVEFVINKKKRTIVALLKSISFGAICGKGIAKAAPDDCFNEHIGKAIALHRALGLEVPDEYLNAPQPTEVRVGDVVKHTVTSEIATVIEDDSWPPLTGAYVYQRDVESARRYARIIDDSRTEVGEWL
ncbi:hypothetical protein P8881_16540 [Bacillus haynesii]|nr:hypothetical protein [Bacillus haynesii]MEC0739232.1 hypothetical protein [Bacillus haynesii]